jgi:hypothetical protein
MVSIRNLEMINIHYKTVTFQWTFILYVFIMDTVQIIQNMYNA